jgi:hypothetical protein
MPPPQPALTDAGLLILSVADQGATRVPIVSMAFLSFAFLQTCTTAPDVMRTFRSAHTAGLKACRTNAERAADTTLLYGSRWPGRRLATSAPSTAARKGPVQNELTLRQIVDGISALLAVLTLDGEVEQEA